MSPSWTRACLTLSCILFAFLSGCGDDHPELDCGLHGEAAHGHCHCEAGYADDGTTCVPSADVCGGHGHLDGDACHCDAGYELDGETCVEVVEAVCGGHGHLDGTCHCDAGYELDGETCVEVVETACGGHGHLDDGTCHCDAGYELDGETCVEVVVTPPAPPSYAIVPVGDTGMASYGLDLNDLGQVCGNMRSQIVSATPPPLLAFLWTEGELLELGRLPVSNDFSRGYGVNTSGVVVGESGNSTSRAFRWDADAGMTDLGTLGGASAVAWDINDDGAIVGSSSTGTTSRAFLWREGVMQELGSLDGLATTPARAQAINAHGDVAGYSRNAAGVVRATLWTASGSLLNLGYLLAGQLSWAIDLNASQQVVGSAVVGATTSGTSIYHAFFWEDGVIRDLGTLSSLPTAIHSEARGINDDGWAVGYVAQLYGNTTLGDAAAVLWIDGYIFDLNELVPPGSGWDLRDAESINAHGDIVGWGTFDGITRAVVLRRQP